jgi:hypothetical protein
VAGSLRQIRPVRPPFTSQEGTIHSAMLYHGSQRVNLCSPMPPCMVDRPNPAPGWYPDPLSEGSLRAWDGSRWTVQTRSATDVGPSSAPGTAQQRSPTEASAAGIDAQAGKPAGPAADGPSEVGRSVQRTGPFRSKWRPRDSRAATAPAPRPDVRRKDGTNSIVVVLLLLFALSGVYEVVTGSSSGNNNPTRFADPTTLPVSASAANIGAAPETTLRPSGPPGPCDYNPSAGLVMIRLMLQKFPITSVRTTGEPATSTVTAGPVPATPSVCSTEVFTDRRGAGVSYITVYATLAEATTAAGTVRPGQLNPVAIGPVVLALSPSLTTLRSSYRSAIELIIERSSHETISATTPPTPASARPRYADDRR